MLFRSREESFYICFWFSHSLSVCLSVCLSIQSISVTISFSCYMYVFGCAYTYIYVLASHTLACPAFTGVKWKFHQEKQGVQCYIQDASAGSDCWCMGIGKIFFGPQFRAMGQAKVQDQS